ncbi:pectate lyase protein [Salinisphaera shabanensis E1L3A]|uniref:Pectate lyase protein n=1 Tax=Salinisphaera shabanensis E1L3A TaxID=1033802 RepID=U2FRA1_9GAMM|nr:right-handed parallel beta-helix repeat-containing protein [Salinisphaera shabanensis]ERJ18599.1 pectate lyase protein [Salinisphaera shabanensis E1L3A]
MQTESRYNPRTPGLMRLALKAVAASVLCLCITAASHAAEYYVAPHGNNDNAGSQRAPWRSIEFALRHAHAGDTVYLRAGRYREAVRMPRSGSRENGMITLRNYPFETAVIDGSGLRVAHGEQGLITVADRSYVRIQGLQIANFHSDDESVPMGIFVTGAGAHIELIDNHISAIETRKSGCDGNALGIAVYGRRSDAPLRDIRIAGNEVTRLKTGCSESISINGNVTDFEVVGNAVHDNNNIGIDVIGHEGMARDPAVDIARNGVIADNTVYNITSSANSAYPDGEMAAGGIYVDGGRDIVIERNRVFANDIGIELASEHGGHATRDVVVRNNLIYNNRSVGLSIGGYAPDVGGTVDCRIVHNTFYKNDTAMSWGGEVVIQYNARDNVFENNIVYANAQAVFINYYVDSTTQPLSSDRNLFYTEAGRYAGQWQWRAKHYDDMGGYARVSGNDRESLFGHPRIASARYVPDFALRQQTGPLVVPRGRNERALRDTGYNGRRADTTDFGAYEYY